MRKLCEAERKERRRLSLLKYRLSEKNKKRVLRYRQTENYKIGKARGHLKERPYVKDGAWHLIEGYDRLLKDGCDETNRKNKWVLHHRKELFFSLKELKEKGLYFDCPPEDLIWLTRQEHNSLHQKIQKLKKLEIIAC